MNLDLWVDGPVVMTALGPKLMVKSSVQFMSKMNCFNNRLDLWKLDL